MNVPILVVLYVLSALAAAFFSAAETALTALSESDIYRLKEQYGAKADRLARLRQDLAQTLSSILLGTNVANAAAGSLGTLIAINLFGERWGVVAATITTTIVFLVFCDVTPKTLAAKRAEEVGLLSAPLIEILVKLLAPITKLVSHSTRLFLRPFGITEQEGEVTQADVKSLINLSHQQGSLEKEETEILHAVLEFGDTPVRDAMISRAQMVTLSVDADFLSVKATGTENRYSRYPVYRGTQDEVVGILHMKDLFSVSDQEERSFDLSRYLRPAIFVPELKKAGDLFKEMRRRRFHMAIVVDELGAVSGLVTLEDLIEEILGDIADEHDEPQRRPILDGTSLIIEGTYPLASLERDLGLSFGESHAETVAGFLLRKLGRIPRSGARVRAEDLDFVVERATPRAIERIRIMRKPGSGEERALRV
ncbi:MAG: HlyC/CorC family transporter [Acidobacteria bacterium]|nr:HlyC/CorC family transporter [Acidobacteriota bacterium]